MSYNYAVVFPKNTNFATVYLSDHVDTKSSMHVSSLLTIWNIYAYYL